MVAPERIRVAVEGGDERATERALSSLCVAFRGRVERDYPGASVGATEGWQRDLAARLDLSQFTISTLWSGKPRNLRLGTVLKLQAYIGRPLDEIFSLNQQ